MTALVRPAAPADAEALHRLNLEFNDARASVAYIAAALASPETAERLFVAELSGRVVGLAGLRLLPCALDPEPYAELTELYVEASARRQGVGRALVRSVEREAMLGGARRLVLLTAWRNTAAQRFYHALGYKLYTVTMQRALDPPPAPSPGRQAPAGG